MQPGTPDILGMARLDSSDDGGPKTSIRRMTGKANSYSRCVRLLVVVTVFRRYQQRRGDKKHWRQLSEKLSATSRTEGESKPIRFVLVGRKRKCGQTATAQLVLEVIITGGN